MSDFRFTPLTAAEATEICSWRYAAGAGIADRRSSDAGVLLLPRLRYHAVRQEAALVGVACFGEDAQVYGGPYQTTALDLGCGLEPSRVGTGQGRAFVAAVVDFAAVALAAAELRLSVLATNVRAIHVYSQNGFVKTAGFAGVICGGTHPFVLMNRRMGR